MRNFGIVKRDEFWTVLTSSKFVDAMTDTARLIVPSPDLRDLPIVRKIPLATTTRPEGSPTARREVPSGKAPRKKAVAYFLSRVAYG